MTAAWETFRVGTEALQRLSRETVVPIPADIQSQGMGSEHMMELRVSLCVAGGWTRWLLRGPSNSNNYIILYCFLLSYIPVETLSWISPDTLPATDTLKNIYRLGWESKKFFHSTYSAVRLSVMSITTRFSFHGTVEKFEEFRLTILKMGSSKQKWGFPSYCSSPP